MCHQETEVIKRSDQPLSSAQFDPLSCGLRNIRVIAEPRLGVTQEYVAQYTPHRLYPNTTHPTHYPCYLVPAYCDFVEGLRNCDSVEELLPHRGKYECDHSVRRRTPRPRTLRHRKDDLRHTAVDEGGKPTSRVRSVARMRTFGGFGLAIP
eukprot:9391802-Pyramimonas_sp.AAC.2